MAARFLDNFSVLLLDMNGTFMFGHDRFDIDQDYFATYRALGGNKLNQHRLLQIVHSTYDAIIREYSLPERFDNFPTLIEAFHEYGGAPRDECLLLEQLFAAHEIGHVPHEHQDFLRTTAATHHLGIVSNICAHPAADVVVESLPKLLDLPPNRSFEPTSVGKPPDAAQLQR